MNKNIKLYINGIEADLTEDISLPITYVQEDLTNPTIVKNSFSKTVTLPGTKTNNSIFGQFYKLDRFSEDLDFALIYPDKNFDLSKYFVYLEKELKAYGLNLEINTKQKNVESNITSAFVKSDTLEHILKFFPNEENHKYNHMLKNIKIKFEVDINPPSGATYEEKYKLLPSPHQIKVYDKGCS